MWETLVLLIKLPIIVTLLFYDAKLQKLYHICNSPPKKLCFRMQKNEVFNATIQNLCSNTYNDGFRAGGSNYEGGGHR